MPCSKRAVGRTACRLSATEVRGTTQRAAMGSNALDDASIQQHVGAAVRHYRVRAGLTQASLAEQAGLHRTYINQVEHGHKAATVVVLVRLARALGITPATLLHEIS